MDFFRFWLFYSHSKTSLEDASKYFGSKTSYFIFIENYRAKKNGILSMITEITYLKMYSSRNNFLAKECHSSFKTLVFNIGKPYLKFLERKITDVYEVSFKGLPTPCCSHPPRTQIESMHNSS